MAGSYEIWLTTDTGARIDILDDIVSGWFSRVANGIGRFMLQLPESFDRSILRPENRDHMIQCWRAPEGGRLSLFRTYFLRRWTMRRVGTELRTEIRGPDVNDLFRRRNVINFSATAGAAKTDFADDMIKEIADEQMVTDGSDPAPTFGARAFPDLTIQADAGAGPTLSESFAWRKLIEEFTDINGATRIATPEVFFDIRVNDPAVPLSMIVTTKTGQPGHDLTASVVFDEERGNLREPTFTYDATEEQNYIYSGGQGTGEARNIQQVWNAGAIGASRYNRCEGFAFAAFAESDDAVREAGRKKLRDGEPQETFTSRAMDTDSTSFGLNWNWGDRVKARAFGREWQTIVRKVTLFLDSSKRETVDARLELPE